MNQKQKQIEPKPLRIGYTTGSCATAATKAALTALITGKRPETAAIVIPNGDWVTFIIEKLDFSNGRVTAGVIKDGGDDPDATHGALIQSTVSWRDDGNIFLDGGEGVGRVTKEGLPVPVGLAAINPVPRKMITGVARQVLEQYGIKKGVDIVISVPDGEKIAKKTLNGRLGILGGISILGTRGTVLPFSAKSYTASISLALQVARRAGCEHVVLTTGGRSEKYAMKQYPHLPEEAFIEMGDFVGYALKDCKKKGIKKISLVGMLGKFSKIAQGEMHVHARKAGIDFSFLAKVAAEAGAGEKLVEEIAAANTAMQVTEKILAAGHTKFFQYICEYCCRESLKETGGGIAIETSLYTLSGEFLGKAEQK